MIIVMASHKKEDVEHVVAKVEELGYRAHVIVGVERTVIAAIGDERGKHRLTALEALPHVERVFPILKPFKLAGREVKQESTVVECGNAKIGGGYFCVMAGPCAVESREQLLSIAESVKAAGATMLRGGAFKPRTSPYSLSGNGAGRPDVTARSGGEGGAAGGYRGNDGRTDCGGGGLRRYDSNWCAQHAKLWSLEGRRTSE